VQKDFSGVLQVPPTHFSILMVFKQIQQISQKVSSSN